MGIWLFDVENQIEAMQVQIGLVEACRVQHPPMTVPSPPAFRFGVLY